MTRAPAALGILAACLLAEAATLTLGLDDLDEGYFIEQASRVLADGQIPYRDFDSLYTPGLTYVHAAVFAALGEPSVVAMRVVSLAARALVVGVLYVLGRRLMPPLWAAVAPVFVLAGLDPAPDRWNTHPGWPGAAWSLLAVWAIDRWATSVHPARWLVTAGAAVGLAYTFKQNAGVFIGLAIAVFVLTHRPSWLRSLAWLALGFGGVCLPWLVALLAALAGDVRPLAPFVGALDTTALFYPPEPFNLLALAALVMGAVLVVVSRAEKDAWRLRWYLVAGLGMFATQYPRMDTIHLAWSAPLLLLLGVAALARAPAAAGRLGLLVLAACAVPMLTWRGQAFVGQPLVPIERASAVGGLLVPPSTRDNLEGIVIDIQARTTPGEPIFVYPTSPLLYVAAERPNPTRYAHLYPGAAPAAAVLATRDTLEARAVRIVIIDDFWRPGWGPPGVNQPLEDYLDGNFREVARYGAYRLLSRLH